MDPHIQSYKKLGGVLGVLLVLTAVTVGVSRLDLGSLSLGVAMVIAGTKSALVLLFFMHLKYESWLIRGSFLMTIGVLALFIGFMFWDVGFR
ncbi:MAG: cytochrome C oxidase subunit IV family protein [Desulfobacterium sp.]|nr:cytochrome C oxidase subunit IV family protein [Desulfobacterium sp.]